MTEVLGLIMARGGSKSVPRKNIKLLAGEPLITYTVKEAKKSKHITRLVLSTDDEEIARVCKRYGAEVPFMRPDELAQDHVTDLPVLQHALKWLAENQNYRPELIVHLRPTAPFRTAEHIDRGVQMLLDDPKADAVRSVCPASQHPLKMWAVQPDGALSAYVPEHVFGIVEAYNMPRQKLPKAFVQNGSVDVVRTGVVLEQNSMTGRNIKALLMEELESINIDSPLDWQLAELLMQMRNDALKK